MFTCLKLKTIAPQRFFSLVVCNTAGSSFPVSTVLKNVVRLAYDYFLTKETVLICHPTHTCHLLSRVFVLRRNLLDGKAGCSRQGQCSFWVLCKLTCGRCRVAQMCRAHGGCECPASALRMLSLCPRLPKSQMPWLLFHLSGSEWDPLRNPSLLPLGITFKSGLPVSWGLKWVD